MHATATAQRPWVAAGIALTAAGMVAVAPVVAPTLPEAAFPDIQLTGLVDQTADNITNLVTYFAGGTPANFLTPRVPVGAPLPILQAVIGNQLGYLGQILDDPANAGTVLQTMFGNLQDGLAAPFGMFPDNLATGGPLDIYGLPVINLSGIGLGTYDLNTYAENALAGLLGADNLSRLGLFNSDVLQGLASAGGLQGLLNFSASPVSGVMLGAAGPVIGPMLALYHGLQAAGSDPAALLGIPENMLNVFLNGGESLNISDLLGLVGVPTTFTQDLGTLGWCPICVDLGTLTEKLDAGIAMGGLLGGPGSLFNALTAQAGVTYDTPDWLINQLLPLPYHAGANWIGEGAGPLGSLMSVPNSIAAAITNPGTWDGLLPTLATGLGINELAAGFNDIQNFLTQDVLGQLNNVLGFLPHELAGLFDSLLGADLRIDAVTGMVLNIPALLLQMLL